MSKRIGQLIGYLFFAVFAGVGVTVFVTSVFPLLSNTIKASSWEHIQADLIEHNLAYSHGETTTYKATAKYGYTFRGSYYQGDRVSFNSGSDNIGSYHQDMNRQLGRLSREPGSFMVWVNPKQPSEAVIDKSIRWGLLAFKSLFVVLFGGAGFVGIYVMYRSRNKGEALPNTDPNRPWTQYKEWSSPTLYSGTKLGNKVMLGFAVFWNLIAWPSAIPAIDEVKKGNYLALVAILFPIVGMFLFWLWFKGHRSYKLTGDMPLELNPYPASIGGQAGGVIHCGSTKFNQNLKGIEKNAKIIIEYIRYTTSGSGKNRTTHQTVLYEDTMVPSIKTTIDGLEIRFCFDLDDSLGVSEPPLGMPRKAWRISFSAETDKGLKIERDYNGVPVFATKQSSTIRDTEAYAASSIATIEAAEALAESILDLEITSEGYRLFFPAFKNYSMLLGIFIGLVFCTVGLFIPSLVFNIIFPLLGGGIFLASFYAFANSLEVVINPAGISAKRRLFFYQFKPQFVAKDRFDSFTKKSTSSSTSSGKTTRYFKIVANGIGNEKAIVVEGLKGEEEANAAISKLQSIFPE